MFIAFWWTRDQAVLVRTVPPQHLMGDAYVVRQIKLSWQVWCRELGLHLQDPFSTVAQLEAAAKAASVSHLRQSKSPPKMQQPRSTPTLSLKVDVRFATMLDSHRSPASSP